MTTSPTGLTVIVDGAALTSPQTFRWSEGSTHTIGAPSVIGSGGTRNNFMSWNDGGTESHTVITPATSSTYTAQYQTQYLLSPVVLPANAGNILVTPTSVDGFYNAGTVLQTIATANTGYFFGSWSGAATGSDLFNPARR